MALFAEGILNLYWDQSVPVNLARIAKKMGIAIVLSDTLAECASLDISPHNLARITIGTRHPVIHQRYAVAQALGHRALHHLRPGTHRLIAVQDNFAVDHTQRNDSEANEFALGLLVPAPVLRYSVQAIGPRPQPEVQLQELAHVFNVPPLLIKQRLADLDLRLPQPLALQVNRMELL